MRQKVASRIGVHTLAVGVLALSLGAFPVAMNLESGEGASTEAKCVAMAPSKTASDNSYLVACSGGERAKGIGWTGWQRPRYI